MRLKKPRSYACQSEGVGMINKLVEDRYVDGENTKKSKTKSVGGWLTTHVAHWALERPVTLKTGPLNCTSNT